jgi:hypothetical protein
MQARQVISNQVREIPKNLVLVNESLNKNNFTDVVAKAVLSRLKQSAASRCSFSARFTHLNGDCFAPLPSPQGQGKPLATT